MGLYCVCVGVVGIALWNNSCERWGKPVWVKGKLNCPQSALQGALELPWSRLGEGPWAFVLMYRAAAPACRLSPARRQLSSAKGNCWGRIQLWSTHSQHFGNRRNRVNSEGKAGWCPVGCTTHASTKLVVTGVSTPLGQCTERGLGSWRTWLWSRLIDSNSNQRTDSEC